MRSKYPLDKHLYAQRHLVECCFSKLKQFRRVATRFEKTARNYLAVVTIAAIALWMQVSTPPRVVRQAERPAPASAGLFASGPALCDDILVFRMLLQIVHHKAATGDDLVAIGADQIQRTLHQLGGDAASAQGARCLGVRDDHR